MLSSSQGAILQTGTASLQAGVASLGKQGQGFDLTPGPRALYETQGGKARGWEQCEKQKGDMGGSCGLALGPEESGIPG